MQFVFFFLNAKMLFTLVLNGFDMFLCFFLKCWFRIGDFNRISRTSVNLMRYILPSADPNIQARYVLIELLLFLDILR